MQDVGEVRRALLQSVLMSAFQKRACKVRENTESTVGCGGSGAKCRTLEGRSSGCEGRQKGGS